MSATLSGAVLAGLALAYAGVVLLTDPRMGERGGDKEGGERGGEGDPSGGEPMAALYADPNVPMRHFRQQGRGREGRGAIPNEYAVGAWSPDKVNKWADSRIERQKDYFSYDDPAYGVGSTERQRYITGGSRAMENPRAGRYSIQPAVKHAFNPASL